MQVIAQEDVQDVQGAEQVVDLDVQVDVQDVVIIVLMDVKANAQEDVQDVQDAVVHVQVVALDVVDVVLVAVVTVLLLVMMDVLHLAKKTVPGIVMDAVEIVQEPAKQTVLPFAAGVKAHVQDVQLCAELLARKVAELHAHLDAVDHALVDVKVVLRAAEMVAIMDACLNVQILVDLGALYSALIRVDHLALKHVANLA